MEYHKTKMCHAISGYQDCIWWFERFWNKGKLLGWLKNSNYNTWNLAYLGNKWMVEKKRKKNETKHIYWNITIITFFTVAWFFIDYLPISERMKRRWHRTRKIWYWIFIGKNIYFFIIYNFILLFISFIFQVCGRSSGAPVAG